MEYVYTAMLLHSAGQKISEENIKKVLTAAGAKPDAARIKALVASLDGVNIDEAIKTAAAVPIAAAAPVQAAESPAEEKKGDKKGKKEEKKEEVSEEEAAAGLSALFD